MPLTQNAFQVEYSYYSYNSGRSDNGDYTETLYFATLEEAVAVARSIQRVISGMVLQCEDEYEETFRKYHPYSGSFNWVRVWKTQREELNLVDLFAKT